MKLALILLFNVGVLVKLLQFCKNTLLTFFNVNSGLFC